MFGVFLFPLHAKELVLLYEAERIAVGVKQVSQILLLWSTPLQFATCLCLTKDSCLPFRANVAQQDHAENNLDLNLDGGSKKHCFGFTSLGRAGLRLGVRLHGTVPRWTEELVCESQGSPSSPGGASC